MDYSSDILQIKSEVSIHVSVPGKTPVQSYLPVH